jgi:diaminohydroxyphosphoribosylaminopyrimidine deaminase/5-amino-6-(5-phosphoribosylamino)uracil reductase
MDRYEDLMDAALTLAERGWGRVSPNPMVGAVVVDPDGTVLGEGWHEGPGTPHAEVMALGHAGPRAAGSTVVCTLEPCDRSGRTPPCTTALIEARVATVIIAATDPHLGEDAPGARQLRDAGIEVHVGVREEASRRLNAAFERHVRTGRPFVVVKTATSFDGKTAAIDGSSRWITSGEARADAHHLRAWSDGVAVGSGTATADDPALTVREAPGAAGARPPLRVLVDASGRAPAVGALFDGAAPTLVATTDRAPDARVDAWHAAGADVVPLPSDPEGGVSLPALLDHLGKRDVQGLLVEGGATLAWSFVRDGLVDRIVTYMAPSIIGGADAPGMIAGAGFAPVTAARRLTITHVSRVGPDLKVEADVHGDHRRTG